MKHYHYLNYEEFKEFVTRERPQQAEFQLNVEDIVGDTTLIRFRKEQFFGTIILYAAIFMCGVGILQDDAMGWDNNITSLWETLTLNYEMKPYVEIEADDKNLFN